MKKISLKYLKIMDNILKTIIVLYVILILFFEDLFSKILHFKIAILILIFIALSIVINIYKKQVNK